VPNIRITKNLGEVEEMLSDGDFFRIHKQFLINMRLISKYIRGDGGYVVMPDGVNISVSRVKKKRLQGFFGDFEAAENIFINSIAKIR
jgi:two-component system LytT family response regulator